MSQKNQELLGKIQGAKSNPDKADALIEEYLPFIKSQTAKLTGGVPESQWEDELSVAMFAFYEAVMKYDKARGSFLGYAEVYIKNRLIDYFRKEKRHKNLVSLDDNRPDDPSEPGGIAQISYDRDEYQEMENVQATREELNKFSKELEGYGITLTEVAENCPRQERTRHICMRALDYGIGHGELLNKLVKSKRLPISHLSEGAGLQRKTLERHRKYLVAIFLAYTNGFEIIRGHLKHIRGKGGEEQ